MVRNAKRNFSENFIRNLNDTDPSIWMKRMKRIGMASFENKCWHFPNEDNSNQSLTDEMADYFANISKNFPAVDPTLLDLVSAKAKFVS